MVWDLRSPGSPAEMGFVAGAPAALTNDRAGFGVPPGGVPPAKRRVWHGYPTEVGRSSACRNDITRVGQPVLDNEKLDRAARSSLYAAKLKARM
ncbi:MAG TPA: hypothetical protein VE398_18175 [Acidobacteriota bacterium]|nr:hypothetical protein [Acidobacteriota bacterium]